MADGTTFDAYHLWLAIPPQDQPADHYRLLGLARFEENADVIANAADQRMAHIRQVQTGERQAEAQRLLNEISRAQVVLLNPEQKREYDAQLRSENKPPPASPEPPLAGPKLHASGPLPMGPAQPSQKSPPSLPTASPAVPAVRTGRSGTTSRGGSSRARPSAVPVMIALALLGMGGMTLMAGVSGAWYFWPSTETVAAVTPGNFEFRRDNEEPATPVAPPPSPWNVEQEENEEQQEEEADDEEPKNPSPTVNVSVRPSPSPVNPPRPRPTVNPPATTVNPTPKPPTNTTVTTGPTTTTAVASPLEPERLSPPSPEQQQEVLDRLEEIYPAEELESSEQRAELAREFLKMGGDAQTVSLERFVLLRRAAELAAEGGDVRVMSQAVARLAEDFDLDSVTVEAVLLTRMAAKDHYQANAKAYVEHVEEFADDSMRLDRFDAAERVLTAALTLPTQSLPATTRAAFEQSLEKAHTGRQLYRAVEEARRAIAIDDADADAHWVLARWYCFQKKDWERGLVHLANCSHPQLQSVAAAELAADKTTPAGRLATGDLWWDLVDAVDAEFQPILYDRSVFWYRQVKQESLGGLDRYKLEKRLAEYNAKFASAAVASGTSSSESDDRFISLFQKGIAAVRQKNFGDADRYFSHCIRIAPDDPAAINNYALTGLRMGQSQRAVRQWQRLVDRGVALPELLQNLRRMQTLVRSGEIPLDRDSQGELDTLVGTAESAGGSFGSYRSRTGYLYAVIDDTGRKSPYEDRNCMVCDGDGRVDCPVRGCSRGKVRVTKQSVVATNPITGQPIIGSTSVSVRCQRCYGKGDVQCTRCDDGIDRRVD